MLSNCSVGEDSWDGRWHHQLNGHEFEPTPGDNERQGSPACCRSQDLKERDTIEWQQQRQIWNNVKSYFSLSTTRYCSLVRILTLYSFLSVFPGSYMQTQKWVRFGDCSLGIYQNLTRLSLTFNITFPWLFKGISGKKLLENPLVYLQN